jgi:Domain of unknown function (DUF2017)
VGDDQPRLVTSGGDRPGEGTGPDDDEFADPSGSYLEELMGGFRATANGVTARFGRAQAAILRDLVGQVTELITGEAPEEGGPAGGAPGGPAGPPPGWPEDGPVAPDDLASLAGLTGNPQLPDDPALARLLPDAYQEDPEASAEFRRYTESGLRAGKAAAARTVLATLPPQGGRIRLSQPDAQAWLRALNDVRLWLGTRLEVTEDFDAQAADMAADDPNTAVMAIYQWLGIVQESLVEALS